MALLGRPQTGDRGNDRMSPDKSVRLEPEGKNI